MLRLAIPTIFLVFIVAVIFTIPAFADHDIEGHNFHSVTKQVDETVNNSSVVQADDELRIPLQCCNEAYSFDLKLYIDGHDNSDFKYSFTVPTNAIIEVNDVAWEPDFSYALLDGTVEKSINMGDTTEKSLQITGRIINEFNTGDVVFNWAQNFDQPNDTVVKAGSTFTVWDGSVVKQVDETVNNSATMQNDDELVVPLEANKSYSFDMRLLHDSSDSADIKWAFTVPTGATVRVNDVRWEPDFPYDTIDGTVAQSENSSTGIVNAVQVTGHVDVAGTAGNLQLQWAQNFQEISNTIVKQGSSLVVYEDTTFTKVKQADETVNNSSTLQNDDDLVIPLQANEAYGFDLRFYVETGDPEDFAWRLDVPTGATVSINDVQWEPDFPYSTLDGTVTQLPNFGGGTDESLQVTGKVVMGNQAGNLQLQWAQKNPSVSNTILNKGSSMVVYDIPDGDEPSKPYWVALKRVDETVNNSATVQQDDELRFPVEANSAYEYEARFFVDSDSTADFRYAFDVPAGTTINVSTTDWQTDNGFLPADATQDRNPSITNTETAVHVNGRIVTAGTAGDVILKWAQTSQNPSDTTVKAGSMIHVYDDTMASVKQVDEVLTSHDDLQNDDDLVVALEPNKVYPFELRLFIDSHATPDFQYDFLVPYGANIYWLNGAWDPDNGNWVTNLTEELYPISSSMGSSEEAWMVTGFVETASEGGNLQFRWAQNTNDAVNETIVKAGSALVVYDGVTLGTTDLDNPNVIVKGIDQTVNNSSTLVPDNDLTTVLEPNTTYGLEGRFVFTTTSSADYRYNFLVPDGSTAVRNTVTWAQDSTFGHQLLTFNESGSTGGGNQGEQIHGYIITGDTQGSLTQQFAQGTPIVTNTVQLAGSSLVLFESTKRPVCDSTTFNSATISHNADLSPTLLGYSYRASTDGVNYSVYTENSVVTDTTYTYQNLKQNTLYYLQYKPVFSDGNAGWSETATCTTTGSTGGSPPDPEPEPEPERDPVCTEDSDFDFINDCDDLCPFEKENLNFFQDEDGCPDLTEQLFVLPDHIFQAFGNSITATPNSLVSNQQIAIQWNNPDAIIAKDVQVKNSPFSFTFENLPTTKRGSGLPLSQNQIFYEVKIPNTCSEIVSNSCVQLVRYEIPVTVLGIINGTTVSDDTHIIIDLSDDDFNENLLLLLLLLLVPLFGILFRRRKKKSKNVANVRSMLR